MHICACVETRGQKGQVSPPVTPHFIFDVPPLNQKVLYQTGLADRWILGALFVSSAHCHDYRSMALCPVFTGFWGVKLRSSRLHPKHYAN